MHNLRSTSAQPKHHNSCLWSWYVPQTLLFPPFRTSRKSHATGVTTEMLKRIVAALQKAPHVIDMTVDSLLLSNHAFLHSCCTRFTTESKPDCQIASKELTETICLMVESPECHLTTLALENCGLESDHARELSQSLSKNKSISSLSLAHNNIGNVGTKSLGQVLSNNSTIVALNLSCSFHTTITMIFLHVFKNHFLCAMTQNSQQGWRNRNRQICSSDIQKHNLGKIGFVSFGSRTHKCQTQTTRHYNKQQTIESV